MYPNNDKISTSQLINIVILTAVGAGVLTLPRRLVEESGTDGWLALIIGAILAAAMASIHGYIVKSFPGKNFFEILSYTLTRPIAYMVGIYTIVYFVGMTGLITRIFSFVTTSFLLPRTPGTVIFSLFALVSAYLVRQGVEVLGRLAEVIILPIGMLILLLFAAAWGEMELSNLLPVFQVSLSELVSAFAFALFSFLGFEVILIFGGSLDQPNKAIKIGPTAIGIILLLYLVLNSSVLGILGAQQTENLTWPLLSTFKTIELPGAFIENVEAFIMTIWIFVIFMTIAPLHLAATMVTRELMGAKEHNYYVLPLLPMIYFIGRWHDSMIDTYEYMGVFTDYTAYGVVILIPIGIALSTYIRKKKEKDAINM